MAQFSDRLVFWVDAQKFRTVTSGLSPRRNGSRISSGFLECLGGSSWRIGQAMDSYRARAVI